MNRKVVYLEDFPEKIDGAIRTKDYDRETKWDVRFLKLAEQVSSWSKDPSTQVGAVIVRADLTIASVGFNGFPRGTSDDPDIYANRPLKYERVVHAELNAILSAKEPLHGCTMYISLPSCARCTACIIQAGIVRVVHYHADGFGSTDWKDSLQIGQDMYQEAGVAVCEIHQIGDHLVPF